MTEVPKIVHERLRAALPNRAVPGGSHPDADLLTAFAEQALSATEREGVLEHLARCGDCRELIALALPAVDTVAAPAEAETERAGAPAPRRLSFAWLSLRWAALAAGVVAAAAVLLMHPGKLNQMTQPPVNPQVATNAQPIPGPQNASAPLASPAMDQSAISAKPAAAPLKSELRLSKKLKAGQAVTPSLQADSGILLAENKIAGNRQDLKEADKLSAPSSAGAHALNYNVAVVPSSSEAVEVTAESATEQAEVSSDVAQDAQAIVKAKTAPQTETSQSQNAFVATAGAVPLQGRSMVSMAKLAAAPSPARARNVTWMIAAGVLQQSLDSGQSWQTALHADHPLLCYASHDQDVWTGGQAGTLFHSADSGVTWLPVQAAIKGQPLTSDITHIDVHPSAEVVISTSNNEIWSSADNGKTWEKK
jgi:hypothetical protein